ncbi:MAG TPA: hypothetical protein VH723_08945 [Candidatus Limnocylindrales bacterium]
MLACIACTIDPQMTGLVLPLAQAAIVAGPIVFREELRKGLRAVRRRRRRASPADAKPGQGPEARPGRRPIER